MINATLPPDSDISCASFERSNTEDGHRGSTTIDIMRIRAGRTDDSHKALVIEVGDPGNDPFLALASTAAAWFRPPVASDTYRAIADRFDLIALMPRGMKGADRLDCPFVGVSPLNAIYADRHDTAAWRGLIASARDVANHCGTQPISKGVDTATRVGDIEAFRDIAGYEKLSFYGAGQGSLRALWYGATYPDRVERTILDGAVDVSTSEEDRLTQGMERRDGVLMNAALQPITDAPHLYGLGTSVNHLAVRFMQIPVATRMVWQMLIAQPADVLAAITLADWLKEGRTLRQVEPAIDTHGFSPSPDIDLAARESAKRLLHALTAPMVVGTQEEAGASSFSVTLATRCNDGRWQRRADAWPDVFRQGMGWSMSLDEADMFTALACAQWPRRPSMTPDFARLSLLPPVLVLNGEYDRHTPWEGAQKTMGLMRTSRAVLLRRGSGRVIDSGPSRCVEHAVSHYLITGIAPLKKVTNCRVQRP